jgi:molybdopterin biosynthesis enzyme
VTIVTYPPRRSVLDVLMNRSDDTASVELKVARKVFAGLPVGAWAQGGFLKIMPYAIKVR